MSEETPKPEKQSEPWGQRAAVVATVLAALVAVVGFLDYFRRDRIAIEAQCEVLLEEAYALMGGELGRIPVTRDDKVSKQTLIELKKAEVKLESVRAKRPNDPRIETYQGIIYAKRGDYKRALESFERAKRIDPHYGKAYSRSAAVYYLQEDYCKSLHESEIAISIDENDPIAFANLGFAARDHEDLERAATAFRTAIELDNSFFGAWEGLAVTLHMMGNLEDAINAYNEWLRFERNNPNAHYGLGEVYRALGEREQLTSDLENAVDHFKRVVSHDPNHPRVYPVLALALMNLERLDEAEQVLVGALDRNVDKTYLYLVLAMVQKADGRIDDALVKYQLAVDRSPDDVQTWKGYALGLREKVELLEKGGF